MKWNELKEKLFQNLQLSAQNFPAFKIDCNEYGPLVYAK